MLKPALRYTVEHRVGTHRSCEVAFDSCTRDLHEVAALKKSGQIGR